MFSLRKFFNHQDFTIIFQDKVLNIFYSILKSKSFAKHFIFLDINTKFIKTIIYSSTI